MYRYLIQHRIKTPMQVFQALECGGFRFLPVDGSGNFLVEGQFEASNYNNAYRQFRLRLVPIINAASVVTQCAVYSFASSPYLIHRVDKNPENIAYFYYARHREAVGMHLDEEEMEDVRKILAKGDEDPKNLVGIGYLRQANLATAPTFFLALLLIAAEAFAGKTKKLRRCETCGDQPLRCASCDAEAPNYSTTDNEILKSILGEQLFRQLYKTDRFRQKLFHGGSVDEGLVGGAARAAYDHILLSFLKSQWGLESVREIVNPPRNPGFEYTWTFLKLPGPPDLVALERAMELNDGSFQMIDEPPGY